MELLHEFLTWLSQEGLAREGLYIIGLIVLVAVMKGSAEGIVNFILRRGDKNEKTN